MKKRPTRSTFLTRLNHFTDTIRSDIRSGALVPGSFLPAETELAAIYGLSKLSIRKGLDQLTEEGWIEKIPRVGTRVAAAGASEGAEVEVAVKQIVKFAGHQSLIREASIEALIQRFEAENPDIQIQFIPFPYQQYLDNIEHYVDNDMIDVISINYDQYMEFSESDRLHLLEPQSRDSSVYPFVEEGFVRDGTLYAAPFVFSPVILCCNKNHFREKRLSEPDYGWSWETLIEASRLLSDDGERYGFYFHLLSQNRWPVFLLQNGFAYDSSNLSDQAERFLDSMILCKDTIFGQRVNKLLIADHDLYAEDLFMKEKASVIMTTYFNLNYLTESEIPYEIAPLPSSKSPRTLLLAIGLSVLQTSPRKEAAQRFVDFLTSYDSQLYIRRHTMSIPSNLRAAESPGSETMYQPQRYSMYRDLIPSFRYYSELGMTSRQLMSLRSELSYFWSELSDGNQLLQALEEMPS
ncbi:extracellular solute-binding protein [Paenibacillus sp. GCM10012303]|uniref:extracellular solute-binding protein n=1 Tax=Paenibacillus sp. GCM10012303 TaxID=3317340 RepID=UPI0036121DEA